MNSENLMRAHRSLIALALLAAGCSDKIGGPVAPGQPLAQEWVNSSSIPTLQQSPTAPPLETYQISYWAHVWKASTVTVNYQPAWEGAAGQPFLSFTIPTKGLSALGDGTLLNKGDSVQITLTIDPVDFSVDFQPSGLVFSPAYPAYLTLWYENANPDLDGNGVVDGNDQTLMQQLTFYCQTAWLPWMKIPSRHDSAQPSISTVLYHFSQYAVSW